MWGKVWQSVKELFGFSAPAPSTAANLLKHAVLIASEQPVIHAGAARLGTGLMRWPLLPATSGIVEGKALSFVHSRFRQSVSVAARAELADYLALSTCGHVFDGWRYLSQS